MFNYFNLLDLSIDNKELTSLSIEYYILFKQNMLISNLINKELEQKIYNTLLK
jgi:hypothetical protein